MDDAPKLDWMYAGPAGHVNTEEYLTGRAVDKTFEQFKLGGAEPLNLDLPAPTLPREKSSVPKIQVDVARKVQEDPLLKIRRQEEERKAALREQMLIQQRLQAHTKKASAPQVRSEKRKGKGNSSDSSDNSDLDSKLALKLKKLKQAEKKESLDEKIAKKLKKLKKRKESISSSSSESSCEKNKRREKKYSSRNEKDKSKESYNRSEKSRTVEDRQRRPSDVTSIRDPKHYNDRRRRSRSRSRERDSRGNRSLPRQRVESTALVNKRGGSGMKLSEEELEKRRREMMQNAVTREHERKVKVDNYRKEVEDEAGQLNANRPKEAEFVKKQLASVTSNTTVEARIKANVFNIQRSVNSMDSNFARR